MGSGERNFKTNAVIFFEDDPVGPIYLIREGKVQLTRKDIDRTQILGPGDLIGVPSAVAQMNRLYTARVLEEVTTIEIPVQNFKTFIKNNIALALKIVQKMCAELRELNQILAKPVVGDGMEKGLLDMGDFFFDKNQSSQALYAYEVYLETYTAAENYEDVAFKLAGLYEKQGNIDRSVEIYQMMRDRFPPQSMKWEAYNKLARNLRPFASQNPTAGDSTSVLSEVFGSLGGAAATRGAAAPTAAMTPTPAPVDKDNIIGFLLDHQEKSK